MGKGHQKWEPTLLDRIRSHAFGADEGSEPQLDCPCCLVHGNAHAAVDGGKR